MSALLERIRSEARQLPLEEQESLALELLEASAGDMEPLDQVSAAWDAEISRRAVELKEGRVVGIPWKKVEENLAREFGWNA